MSNMKKCKVSTWGHALGIRIPTKLVKELGLGDGDEASCTVENGQVIIRVEKSDAAKEPKIKRAAPAASLAALLDKVAPENRHDVVDFGMPVGNEVI